jgi:hypothetical protein
MEKIKILFSRGTRKRVWSFSRAIYSYKLLIILPETVCGGQVS